MCFSRVCSSFWLEVVETGLPSALSAVARLRALGEIETWAVRPPGRIDDSPWRGVAGRGLPDSDGLGAVAADDPFAVGADGDAGVVQAVHLKSSPHAHDRDELIRHPAVPLLGFDLGAIEDIKRRGDFAKQRGDLAFTGRILTPEFQQLGPKLVWISFLVLHFLLQGLPAVVRRRLPLDLVARLRLRMVAIDHGEDQPEEHSRRRHWCTAASALWNGSIGLLMMFADAATGTATTIGSALDERRVVDNHGALRRQPA